MIYQLVFLLLGYPNLVAANEDLTNQIQIYQEQLAQQPYQSEWYQQIAILAAQKQDWGLALSFAETALRIDPWSSRAKQIWDYLSEQEGLKIQFSSLDFWTSIYESGLIFIPWWLVVSVLALFFIAITIRGGQIWLRLHLIRRYRLDLPRPWKAFGLTLISGLIVFILAANKIYFETQSFARVSSNLNLRSQPSDAGPELTTLSVGKKVRVIQTYQEWCLVKAATNQLGWVNKKQLVLLPTIQEIYQ